MEDPVDYVWFLFETKFLLLKFQIVFFTQESLGATVRHWSTISINGGILFREYLSKILQHLLIIPPIYFHNILVKVCVGLINIPGKCGSYLEVRYGLEFIYIHSINSSFMFIFYWIITNTLLGGMLDKNLVNIKNSWKLEKLFCESTPNNSAPFTDSRNSGMNFFLTLKKMRNLPVKSQSRREVC